MPSPAALNQNQLKLFMTGTEWKSQITHSTDGPIDRVWPQKTEESKSSQSHIHGAGLYDSMKERGFVRDPNPANDPTIVFEDAPNGKSVRTVQSEGHHRVAAAASVEEDTGKPVYLIPRYVDNTAAGRRARRPDATQ